MKEKKMKEKKIITIWGPSSGTGSSFTSINLCKVLNKNSKAIVVDLDIRVPSLGLYMDIDNKESNDLDTILTFVKGNNLTKESLNNNIIKKDNIYWIKGTSSSENFYELKREELITILEKLKENFDYIILDTHSTIFNIATYTALDIADKVFVILEKNVILAKQYKKIEAILKSSNINLDKFELILNKSNKKIFIESKDISTFVNLPKTYELPEVDSKLINSINQGQFVEFLNTKYLKKYNEALQQIVEEI